MDQEEISEKIRRAIKAKLTELGSYIDDELPDYIMVMIANKKDASQMSTDLELFLGDSAEPFTLWLDNLLTRLQSVTKSIVKSDTKSAAPTPAEATAQSDSVVTTQTKEAAKVEPPPEEADTVQQPTSEGDVTERNEAPSTTACLTLHAQEDDEVVFDDDDDEYDPLEPSKPASLVAKAKPAVTADQKSTTAYPLSRFIKPDKSAPRDLLEANKRMISTRGDSDSLMPRGGAQPSRRAVQSRDETGVQQELRDNSFSPDNARYSPDRRRSPERRRSPDRRRSPNRRRSPDRRRSPIRRRSPDRRRSPIRRRSPDRRTSPRRAPASSRLGLRSERDRDAKGSRDHGDRPRDIDRRELDRRDDYRPPRYQRHKFPVWTEDTESRGRSPEPTGGLVSQIGSSAPRVELLSDSSEDEYNPDKPQIGSVASIIKVAERKSSIPEALQANKKLLLRAMADVTKSLGAPDLDVVPVQHAPPPQDKVSAPTDKRLSAKNRIGATSLSARERLGRRAVPAGRLMRRSPELKRRKSRSRSRSRSRQRALEDYDEQDLMEVLRLLQEKRRYKRGGETPLLSSSASEEKMADSEPVVVLERAPSPKFVVTLDAVSDMSKLLPLSQNLDGDDEIDLLDSSGAASPPSRTEDDVSLDLNLVSAISDETNDLSTILCRFLPNCKAGDACPFLHPMCKNGPNCRFGSACKYRHPPKASTGVRCKFNKSCTKPSCPYTHTAKLVNPGMVLSHLKVNSIDSSLPSKPASKSVCRFHPKCTNMDCTYLHPKPCKYGISCMRRNSGCIFTHPTLPNKTQLKWTKPAIAERSTVHS